MPTQIPVHQPSQEELEDTLSLQQLYELSEKKKEEPPSQQGRKEGVLSLPIVYIQGAVHLLTCVSRCLQGG